MKPDYLGAALVHTLALCNNPLKISLPSFNLNFTSLSSHHPSQNPFSDLKPDTATPDSSSYAHAGGQGQGHGGHPQRAKFATNVLLHTNDVGSAAPTNLQPSEDCPTPGLFSCTPQADDNSISACCVQKPGGVLLHVQLWDEDEGVQDSWGIHGLWPDMCDGSFDESTTGDGRAYSASEIEAALPADYLSEMEKVWVSNDESPSAFWAHEWKTHGVRISTLNPSCISNYQTGDEIPPFFGTVLALFHQFPTYQLLANENILPTAAGDDTTYSLDQLQQAIS